ncbi:MAG TPA: hypothetical protein VMC09_01975 [Anaerolineales bacterium]|nr:hypothetical protein [Anaerolineales bacterium]
MKSTTWMYIGGGVLILISLCFMGYGGLNVVASTAPNSQSNWMGLGIGLLCFGLLMVAGGIVLIVVAARKNKQETVQNVTVKVDLPGETKIEQMKCRSCGGTLTADNIKLVNGAPMVTCPYCNTVYQLTEEPKW